MLSDTSNSDCEQELFISPNAKIFVAGHQGLVGSAMLRRLLSLGYQNFLLRSRAELDLRDPSEVRRLFDEHRPDFVLLCAARVGGIWANSTFPADFFYDNIAVQTNVVHEAFRHETQRLLFLGSSCIYPRMCPQPMLEEHLMSGPLEPTNRPYALAKIAGIEMCWSYNRQHGTKYLAVMPTNLFGPGDNYDLKTSHVLPALIRKFHEAKVRSDDNVLLWGSGRPRREFLYVDDLADACILLMNLLEMPYQQLLGDEDVPPLINIGAGRECPIAELAEVVRHAVGFQGDIVWDASMPDGMPRKLLDSTRMRNLGWAPSISLCEGVRLSYADFLRREPNL